MKLLLVGDACAPTGFGRVNTHLACAFKRAGWDVSWLGINATGDAHPLQKDFDIYPAGLMAGDPLGIERIRGYSHEFSRLVMASCVKCSRNVRATNAGP